MSSLIYCDKCGYSEYLVEDEPRIIIRLVNKGLWLCQVCIAKECERQFTEIARLRGIVEIQTNSVFKYQAENTCLKDALTVLANKWTTMANEQIPPEYKDRGLDQKYLRLDNEAAGLSNCAEELLEALKGE